jgi:hypothetical protein
MHPIWPTTAATYQLAILGFTNVAQPGELSSPSACFSVFLQLNLFILKTFVSAITKNFKLKINLQLTRISPNFEI